MADKRTTAIAITIIATSLIITVLTISGNLTLSPNTAKRSLVVFCAGSLYIPLENFKNVYEELNPDVEVILEPSGSLEAVRKVTDLGRRCDVLALADYRLISLYLIDNYTSWGVAFASNRLVLCYTNNSKYSDQINAENWYEILSMPDVKYGFSDPNKDPCGYRSLMAIGLASLQYEKNILKNLVLDRSNIKAIEEDETLHIYVPANLEIDVATLEVRSKSVNLIALLETGALDYAFEYRSVAIQHNLKYIELSPEINLGDPKHDNFYAKVKVYILHNTDKEKIIEGASITYGVTIPSTAENSEDAIKFIQLLVSDTGRSIFESLGQPFLENPIYVGDVPVELRSKE